MLMDKSGWILIRNVSIKAAVLFILLNVAFGAIYPRNLIGSLSGYNLIFPGRVRFPHSDVPEKASNLTTSNLEAMFRSHVLSKAPGQQEFRIVILGDSSVWGFLLQPEQTFSSKIDRLGLQSPNGVETRVYNLGYPTLSVTKDLLLLEGAMRYKPDLIVWFVTLESLVEPTQLESPLLQMNPLQVTELIDRYRLDIPGADDVLTLPSFLERTIVGSRVELSELLRLQLYGFAWAATGVDHYIPETYNERMEDLSSELDYKGIKPGELEREDLYFEAIQAGLAMAGEIPILLVNEPIFISEGENSDIRYNFFYPRWAYDRYRSLLKEEVERNGWKYLDFWDLLPPPVFTDSAIHYTSDGSQMVADSIVDVLQSDFGFSNFSK
jgi:hypothetical protein